MTGDKQNRWIILPTRCDEEKFSAIDTATGMDDLLEDRTNSFRGQSMNVSHIARKHLTNRRANVNASSPTCTFVVYTAGVLIAVWPSNGSSRLAWNWRAVKAYIDIDIEAV